MISITKDGDFSVFDVKKVEILNKKKVLSERQYILSQFVEEINKERIGGKYNPVTGRQIAIKLSHIKDNHTLYYFLSSAKDYKNRNGSFGKYFYGSLKCR